MPGVLRGGPRCHVLATRRPPDARGRALVTADERRYNDDNIDAVLVTLDAAAFDTARLLVSLRLSGSASESEVKAASRVRKIELGFTATQIRSRYVELC